MSETQVISTLPLLTPAERQQILFDWNETSADYPEISIHQWFEAQAERMPNAVLVVFENQSLTYGELNRRANQLADYLISLGVRPKTQIAILAEPSLEMVISCFGVLKAGGAIVFLDATLPLERLEYMIEESGAAVLINSQRTLEKLPEHDLKVVCFDKDREILECNPVINPAVEVLPDNLSWIAYTSGTTGRPKGTLITHRTLCNLSAASLRAYGLTSELRVFDLQGLFGITMAMVCGGTAYFARRLTVLSAPRLAALLRENAINHIAIAPGMLTALSPADFPALRTITVGGEEVSAGIVARWSPGRRFFQNYRCTEALAGTRALCDVSNGQPLTIGRPIINTQVYILDEELQPVPVGVSGELYLSGVGVARGYLHRPELTAERFLPHPFSRAAGQRLYRTGDLGRYRENGEIEYLGRADQQVKVRGYRIELGEIEEVLCEQEGVRQAAAVVRESEVGQQLVAYVCGEAVSGAALRERVREKLPEYMVPQLVVMLEELPLLPNGKVDRRRLQELEVARAEVRQGARTAIEELVCGIWAEVLRLEQVGVEEDFFDLGGHSLLATQVMSRVREVFGVEVPLRRLFETPPVAGLAQSVSVELQNGSGLKLPEIKPAPDSAEPSLSFAQHRLWFLNQLEPDSVAYNMPIAVRMIGRLDVAALEQSVNEIVRRHKAVRTTFRDRMGQPVPIVSEVQEVEVSIIDLSPLSEAERNADLLRRARREARLPFDLTEGPLLRTTLLRLSDEEHVFLITLHHIISDGWSLGVFIREVVALYEGFLTATPARLPELPIQYQSFAHWQREWLNGEVLKKQLDYWKKQLAGALPVLDLPIDRARPAVQRFRGALQRVQFSRELTTKLRELSRHENVTLFITLAAAFQTLLHRYTRQTDICLGVPIANRNRTETEALIGFFVNTLVLRTDLSEGPTFKELLRRVRETALEAYAHQDVPFEMLVEELQPERNLSHAPLFQVMFVLQNARDQKLELPGLRLVPLEMDSETAKFDLTFSLSEAEEGLRGTIEYSTDLFNGETIERLAAH